jgi:hypothetical protein
MGNSYWSQSRVLAMWSPSGVSGFGSVKPFSVTKGSPVKPSSLPYMMVISHGHWLS